MAGSNPVGQGSSPWERALGEPLLANGLIVQQEDAGVASRRSGCDSRWVHFKTTRSCGLAAKAAPLQGDDRWFESTQDYSMEGNEMNDKNALTLRLANGKEQSCRDGYEMWVWYMSCRGIRVDSDREESANNPIPRRRPQTQKTTVRVHVGLHNLMQRPPRYANRQSGSA